MHAEEAQIRAKQFDKKLSRAIQGERVRQLALQELKGTRCPDCNQLVRIEIKVRNITSMDDPIELAEPVAKCRPCRRSFFPSARRIGDGYKGINAGS